MLMSGWRTGWTEAEYKYHCDPNVHRRAVAAALAEVRDRIALREEKEKEIHARVMQIVDQILLLVMDEAAKKLEKKQMVGCRGEQSRDTECSIAPAPPPK